MVYRIRIKNQNKFVTS